VGGRRGLNLLAGGAHQEGMRLFYLIVTTLLLISLGLLEVVAARSMPVTP
jgi:hypothetical protein